MSNKSKTLADLDLKIRAAKRQKTAIEARSDFLKFVKLTMPDPNAPDDIAESLFKDAKHHRALAKVLEKVEKGHLPRLIVTLPPRHGKSELISRRFIPWLMGRDSYRNVIFSTYNEDFAGDFGADVRAIMQQPTYRQIFRILAFVRVGLLSLAYKLAVVAWVCLLAGAALSLAVVATLLSLMTRLRIR